MKSFLCPSAKDRPYKPIAESGGDKKDKPFDPVKDNPKERISFSYCVDAPHPDSGDTVPWTENAKSTVRLLADKKAGPKIDLKDAQNYNHKADGRNVLYHDGHVKWKAGENGIDPDEDDKDEGPEDWDKFLMWWSDPDFYHE